jgi:hypothetical protein
VSTAYLGLGSNIEARANIASGIAGLRREFERTELSPIYRAPAVGFRGNDFLNLVARIDTDLSPLELRDYLPARTRPSPTEVLGSDAGHRHPAVRRPLAGQPRAGDPAR